MTDNYILHAKRSFVSRKVVSFARCFQTDIIIRHALAFATSVFQAKRFKCDQQEVPCKFVYIYAFKLPPFVKSVSEQETALLKLIFSRATYVHLVAVNFLSFAWDREMLL